MQAILVIVVVVVLAFLGYEYVYKGEAPPPTAEQAVQRARDAASEAAAKAREAVSAAAQAVGPAAEQATEALRQGADQVRQGAQQLGEQARQAAGDARAYLVDGVDLGRQARDAVGNAQAAFSAATDPAAAEAQLPALRDLDATLDGLGDKLGQLSAEARRGFAGLVAGAMPAVRSAAERVKAIDGLSPEVRATIDSIVAKLDGWSRAPA